MLRGGDERLPQLAQREFIFSAYVIGMELFVNRCIFSGKDIDALKLGVFTGRESGCMEHFIQEAVEVDPRV